MRLLLSSLSVLLGSCLALGRVHAAEAQVAVAANFAEPIKAIAAEVHKITGHTLKITLGSTGKLYAQIRNGAPLDVLLAADTATPQRLEQDGLAQPGSRFTYANGQLALWSARAGRVDDQGAVLRAADLGKVALAAPKLAPYGAAAVQAMDRMGLTDALRPRLVQGESIGQAFNFVATGNADVGFVALSQVMEAGRLKSGSVWVLPPTLYSPIRQDAVLLRRGARNEAAQALMQLLQSPQTRELIRAHGYTF
ncbi:MAG: molybdate ABC transporter substrate-binding protein [Hydrogenophaga sp.]